MRTSRPRVAILDHTESYFPLDVYEAIHQEIEPIWVVTERDMSTTRRRLLARVGTVVDIAALDLDSAAEAIAARGPQGILTFVDDLLVVCAELAARLGLRAHRPEVAAALIDKRGQRAALKRAGVPGPRFWSVSADPSPEEIESIAAEAAFPVVVKEAEGAASRNQYAAESADVLRKALAGEGQGERIVEEFLVDLPDRDPRFGSYLSVESMVHEGRVRHLATVGRTPLAEPFRETGVFTPALPEDVSDAVLDAATDAVRALGVRTGLLHIEIKLTPDGPRVIEINGRLGGGPPYVVREATGGINLWVAACRLAVGELPDLPDPLPFERVAFWLVLQAPAWATHVRSLERTREVSDLDAVHSVMVNRHPGEEVDWRVGSLGHVVAIRGQVADHRALAETLDAIYDTIEIEYTGESVTTAVRAER